MVEMLSDPPLLTRALCNSQGDQRNYVVISCQILYYYFVKGYFGGESGILLSSFQGHSTRSILTLHYLIALAHSKSGLEFP
jgi:hypothetical protein